MTFWGFIFYRKNECFWNSIYERPDGFHQNIMSGPMVFIFYYARLQSREFLPLTIARDNMVIFKIRFAAIWCRIRP